MKLSYVLQLCLMMLVLTSHTALAQSKKSSAAPANAYAVVGDGVITKEIFEQALKESLASGRSDTPQLRNEIRNILVNQELLVQEALKQGLDKKPEHRRAIQNLRQNYLVQLMLRENLQKNPITEDQIRQEFEQRYGPKAITGQLEYKISSWVFPGDKDALAMIERLNKGESTEKIEKALGIRKEQRSNQDVWVSQTNLAKPVMDVIVYLNKGGHTLKPILINNTWHVIRLEDQRALRAPNYEDVKNRLANLIIERRHAEYLERLRAATVININP